MEQRQTTRPVITERDDRGCRHSTALPCHASRPRDPLFCCGWPSILRLIGAAAVQNLHRTVASSSTVVGFPNPLARELSDSAAARQGVSTNPGTGRSPLVSITATSTAFCPDAVRDWNEHQADRAWVEWGICWPPFTVRRPRCVACGQRWPCVAALGAHAHLATCETHRR
jgi:hypothetical protein